MKSLNILSFMDTLTALYEQHAAELHRYARQRLSAHDADDLVQDLFLRFCEHQARHTQTDFSRPYAFASLRHCLYDFLRKKDPTPQEKLEDYVDTSPEQDYDQAYYSSRVHEALRSLTPKKQDVIRLWLEGCSYHDIAERLGISYPRVKQYMFRGLPQLQEKLRFILQERH